MADAYRSQALSRIYYVYAHSREHGAKHMTAGTSLLMHAALASPGQNLL